MPQVVAHILVTALLIALFRDYYLKKRDRRKFPLHYVLIAGVGGILPDIDIIFFWVLRFYNYAFDEVHRYFTHTLVLPVALIICAFLFRGRNVKELGKHRLILSNIFLIVAFATLTHLVLDAIFIGKIMPLYPFSTFSIGINLVQYLPQPLDSLAMPTLDALLLVLWIVYLELKHKISDFI